jgi:hypothetical protein
VAQDRQPSGLDLRVEERVAGVTRSTILYGIDARRGSMVPVQSIEANTLVSRFSGIDAFVTRSDGTRLELVQLDPPGFINSSDLESIWAAEPRSLAAKYFSFRSCPKLELANGRLVISAARPFAAHLLSSPRAEFPYALAVHSNELVFVAQACKAERRGPLEELSAIMAPDAVAQGSLAHLTEAEAILLHNVYRRIARNTYRNVLGWRVSDEVIAAEEYLTILKALYPKEVPNQDAGFQQEGSTSTTGQPAFDRTYLDDLQRRYGQKFSLAGSGNPPYEGFVVRLNPGEIDQNGAVELARALTNLWGKEVQIGEAPSGHVYVRFGTEERVGGDDDFDVWFHTHPVRMAPDGTIGAAQSASVRLRIENGEVRMDQQDAHDLLWAYRRERTEVRIVTAYADITHVIPWGQTVHVRTAFGRVPVQLPALKLVP